MRPRQSGGALEARARVREQRGPDREEAGPVARHVVAPVVPAISKEEPGDGEQGPDEDVAGSQRVVVADRRQDAEAAEKRKPQSASTTGRDTPSTPTTRRSVRYETMTG